MTIVSSQVIVTEESSMMNDSEKFCLRWDDFQTSIVSSFGNMRKDDDFSDVTLICDGDLKIEAHKVILAASSSFFKTVLKQNKHPHPVFYMRGITTIQLSAALDLIYYGEVNIFEENLAEFLTLAEDIKLRGLNKCDGEATNRQNIQTQVKKFKQRYNPDQLPLTNVEPPISYSYPKVEENSLVLTDSPVKSQKDNEELDLTINSMLKIVEDGKYSCNVCGKIDQNIRASNSKQNMKNHIEAKHIVGISLPCSQCGKSFRSRSSLACHTSKYHNSK